MGNRYKSELANRIAEKKPRFGRQLGVLVAAVAACAVLVGAAGMALPIMASGSGNCPVTFEVLIEQDQDYLVPVDVTDELTGEVTTGLQHAEDWTGAYDLMRIANLKKDTFQTPGLYAKTYTKFVYGVTVKLQSLANIDLADGVGLTVGHLEITGVGAAEQFLMGASLSINGVVQEISPSAFVSDNLVVGTLLETVEVDVVLPDLAYTEGDEVMLFVMYKSALTEWAGGFAEEAFPEFADYVAPVA